MFILLAVTCIPTFYFNSAYTALSDNTGAHLGVRKLRRTFRGIKIMVPNIHLCFMLPKCHIPFCLQLYSVSSCMLILYIYHRNCYGVLYCLCSGIKCNFTIPNMNNKYIIPFQVNDERTVQMLCIQYCNLKDLNSFSEMKCKCIFNDPLDGMKSVGYFLSK
jgi:hypothetical protein